VTTAQVSWLQIEQHAVASATIAEANDTLSSTAVDGAQTVTAQVSWLQLAVPTVTAQVSWLLAELASETYLTVTEQDDSLASYSRSGLPDPVAKGSWTPAILARRRLLDTPGDNVHARYTEQDDTLLSALTREFGAFAYIVEENDRVGVTARADLAVTLDVTEGNDTVAATATKDPRADISYTEEPDILAASSFVITLDAALDVTEEDDAVLAVMVDGVLLTADSAYTEDDDTLLATAEGPSVEPPVPPAPPPSGGEYPGNRSGAYTPGGRLMPHLGPQDIVDLQEADAEALAVVLAAIAAGVLAEA
jgi:hypothetical protein